MDVSPCYFPSAKRRVLANGQRLVRFDEGMESPLEEADESRLSELVTRGFDGLMRRSSPTTAPECSDVLLDRVLAAADGVPLIVDVRHLRAFRRARPVICTPNAA